VRRAAVYWALPALLVCAGLAALGAWQLQRAGWKERVLAGWSAALVAPPRAYAEVVGQRLALPRREDAIGADPAPGLPLRVEIVGHWDPATTVLLDNQRLDAAVGALVFTRFVPDGRATPLLINRGWVALEAGRRIPPLDAPTTQRSTLQGLLVAPPATGIKLGVSTWTPGQPPALLTWLDLPTIAGASGPLFDGVLQLDPELPHGFTRRWQALPNTLSPQKHRGYAVQWFGLSLAVAAIYCILALRRRP
jgi:surfeit locus 1 family protein